MLKLISHSDDMVDEDEETDRVVAKGNDFRTFGLFLCYELLYILSVYQYNWTKLKNINSWISLCLGGEKSDKHMTKSVVNLFHSQ